MFRDGGSLGFGDKSVRHLGGGGGGEWGGGVMVLVMCVTNKAY